MFEQQAGTLRRAVRLLLAAAVVVSAPAGAQGVQESLSDLRLATAVRLALAADPATAAADARVSARAGAVVVDAAWPTPDAAARAAAVAGAVPGVATLAMGDGPARATAALGAGAAAEPDEAPPAAGDLEDGVQSRHAPADSSSAPDRGRVPHRAVVPAPPTRTVAPPPPPPAAPAPAARAPAVDAPEATHVVRVGDTLYSIARRYGTTVAELQRLNGLGDSTAITLGRRLRVRE